MQHCEIPYQDPFNIFVKFADKNATVFLDSAQLREHSGRYSFIAVDPFLIMTSKNGIVTLGGQTFAANPFDVLAAELTNYPQENLPNLPPFQGGIAGFFSYDLCHQLEKIAVKNTDDMEFPDLAVGFYDLVLAFDHALKKAWIFSSGHPDKNRKQYAKKRLDWMLAQLKQIPELQLPAKINLALQANHTCESYQIAVQKVINYILSGDIFEANIAQRFQALLPDHFSSLNLYQQLRRQNPAPFAAYVRFDETTILSASPERFLKLTEKKVETRPIKGTRPRGKNQVEDEAFANELLTSEKDHAENVMIVDLLRNDLSRVCLDHTVEVPQLCGLESYAAVHHLVSVVLGQLRPELTAVDLLRAAFPGGSITGAPKIRAMEIIAEIESTQRGPYCGSIGYIGFNGDMDSSIVIRTFCIKNNKLTFQAGGAIVADSDPCAEYEETLTKAKALYDLVN